MVKLLSRPTYFHASWVPRGAGFECRGGDFGDLSRAVNLLPYETDLRKKIPPHPPFSKGGDKVPLCKGGFRGI